MLTRKTDTNIYFNSVIYRALTVGLFMEIGIIFTAMFIVYIGYKVIYKKKVMYPKTMNYLFLRREAVL